MPPPQPKGGGKVVKLIVVLIILIALGVAAKVAMDKFPASGEGGQSSWISGDALKRLYGGDLSLLPPGVNALEPSDCQSADDAWVKKGECQVDGLALTGEVNSCGAGKEIWIRDPEHSSFVAAVGTGTCEEEERDCNVECPVNCEGDTYINDNPECIAPTGVVLDGVTTCGVGLRSYELDTSAPDYVAPIGKGTCAMEFKNACDVECPEGVRPETSCVDYANPQKSANGCLVSKLPNARLVTYDEPGFQEWFRLPVDPTAPGCDDKDHMDSWWVPCTGPPRPVNCEGTWGVDGGWDQCSSEQVCESQTQKTRTFTRTKEAAHGGTCNAPADGTTETSVMGCPLLGACCEVDTSITTATSGKRKQPRQGQDPTCVIDANYRIVTEKYPDACASRNPPIPTTTTLGCCWEEDDWSPTEMSAAARTVDGVGKCDRTGKFIQYQTVYGQCDPKTNEREADCEYLGPWVRQDVPETGDCPSGGYQRFSRVTENSNEPSTKDVPCEYIGEWEKDGGCTNSIQKYTRTLHNAPGHDSTWQEACCSTGDWTPFQCKPRSDSVSTGKGDLQQSRSIAGCPAGTEFSRIVPSGCDYTACKVKLREHWCHDGHGHKKDFTGDVANLHPHGYGDMISSYELAGTNCTVQMYEHTNFNEAQWDNRQRVTNKSWGDRQCFNTAGPDNSISSMRLFNNWVRLGRWMGPVEDGDD